MIVHNSSAEIHMIIAAILFSFLGVCVRKLSHLPIIEIVFFRIVLTFIFCFIQLKKEKIPMLGNNKRLLILRGIFGSCTLYLFFFSINHLSYGTAYVLMQLSPIFTAIFGFLILKEKILKSQWVLFLVCFAGVYIVNSSKHQLAGSYFISLGILSAVCAALAYTCIGKLKSSEHPLVIMFYFPLVSILFLLPSTIQHWVWPVGIDWFWGITLGLVVHSAQYFMTLSYQRGDISKVGIINHSQIPMAALLAYFLFKESFTGQMVVGTILIFVGVLANSIVTGRYSRANQK